MTRKKKPILAKFNLAAKAAIPALLLAQPGAASAFRTVSRFLSRNRSHNFNVISTSQVALSHQAEPSGTDPFSAYSKGISRTKTPVRQPEQRTLDFLKENGLLAQSNLVKSSLSGDLGRKSFAASFCVTTSGWIATWYTNESSCTSNGYSWEVGPPNINNSSVSSITSSGFTLNVTVSSSATVYAVVVLRGGSAPNSAQVIAGQDGTGSAAVATNSSIGTSVSISLSAAGADQNLYNVYFVAKDSDGSTATPEVHNVLSSVTFTETTIHTYGSNVFSGLDIEIDGSGNIYTYFQNDSSSFRISKWNGSSWDSYTDLSKGAFNSMTAYRGDMVVDGNGDLHVLTAASTSNYDADGDLYHNKYSSNSWSGFTKVYDGSQNPDYNQYSPDFAFADSSNYIHVAFTVVNDLRYATNKSGSWVPSTIQSVSSGNDGDARWTVVESDGTAHVFYEASNTQDIKTADSSGFASPSTVVDTTSSIRAGNVIVDSSNKLHLVYSNTSDGTAYYKTNTSGSWVEEPLTSTGFSKIQAIYVQMLGSVPYVLMYNVLEKLFYFKRKVSGTWEDGNFFKADSANAFIIDSANNDIHIPYQSSLSTPIKHIYGDITEFITSSPSSDSDGDLIADTSITDATVLSSTTTSAQDIFDFKFTDTGGGDGLDMTVNQITLQLSGTASTNFSKLRFNLTGCATQSTVPPSGSSVTFSGLTINTPDGGSSSTCVVQAYWADNTGLTDNQTITVSVDGDTNVTVDGGGTQMGTTSSVSSNSMATTVTASALAFTTQPATSTSGLALVTQPVVTAQDAFGNTDVDFSETVTLTESSAGILSGDVDITAVSGVATFVDVAYTATADQESFTLTANDQDGVDSNLGTVNANVVTSDVVATQLSFTTQPTPTSFINNQPTTFTTVPVVSAVDANSVVDTGYNTSITMSLTDPNDGTLDGIVTSLLCSGDADGDGTTVTLTPSSGVATYTGLSLTYNAGGLVDDIALEATSGGLSNAMSNNMTVGSPPTVTDNNISIAGNSGIGGVYIIGNTMTVTWDNTDIGDNNSGISSVTVDFSAFGGGASVGASNSSETWTATYTIVPGTIDSNNLNVSVTATSAGGTSTTADSTNATLDNIPPTVSDANLSISGATGTGGVFIVGDTVTVSWSNNSDAISGVTFDFTAFGGGSAVAGSYSNGIWTATYTITSGDIDSSNLNVSATATDNAGNSTTTADTSNATVDSINPIAIFSSALDDYGSVQGNLSSGDTTDDTSLELTGANEAGSTVNVYDGTNPIGSANINGNSWSYTATIVNGTTYQFNVKETDAAGNTSSATSNFTVTCDKTAPTANFSSATDDVGSITGALSSGDSTDDTALLLAGSNEAGSTVTVYDGTTPISSANISGNSWSYTAAIANGTTYQFNVKETDAAGNTSSATSNFIVIGDTTGPNAPSVPDMTEITDNGVSTTDNMTSDTTPIFQGTAESGTLVQVTSSINGQLGSATADGSGNWQVSSTTLNYGDHDITAKATDSAGNESAPSAALSILINHNPSFTGTPTITGSPVLGKTLGLSDTGTTDLDAGDTVTLGYQWLRNDSIISGATLESYRLVQADNNTSITCELTAYDLGGGITTFTTSSVDVVEEFPWHLFIPAITASHRVIITP